MAISFVGSAEGIALNGGDVTLTLPATQQNDLVIVAYAIGDNDSVDFVMAMVTAGYTKVADLHADDTQDTDLGVFWKIMGATPDTTAVVDGQGGADAAVAAVAYVFRGVDPATPMDVAPTTATGINSNIPNPPSIDHLNPAGLWTLAVGAFGHTTSGATMTAPTNYTGLIDATQLDTSGIALAICRRESGAADPEDPGTFTPSIADNVAHSWCAVTIALRPSAFTPTRGRVSWAEFEVPFVPTRGRVSFAELEVPFVPTRGRVSWAELEAPFAPTRGRASQAEFEVPGLPTRGRVSWIELEVPDVGGGGFYRRRRRP